MARWVVHDEHELRKQAFFYQGIPCRRKRVVVAQGAIHIVVFHERPPEKGLIDPGNNATGEDHMVHGRLVAQLHTLRRMSISVNGMLQAGKEPVVEGSIVKDMGTVWEQKLPNRVRELAAFIEESESNRATLEEQLRFATLIAPKLTIQGGTTEVLRGIIARGLGLR